MSYAEIVAAVGISAAGLLVVVLATVGVCAFVGHLRERAESRWPR